MTDANLPEEPLLQHLKALRQSLVRSLLAVCVMFALTAFYAKEIFYYLSLPLRRLLPEGSQFITTHPIEAWYTYLKTAVLAAIFLSAPVIFYQIWTFIAPGLLKSERKSVLVAVVSSSLLFMGGGLFGYFIAFPFGFQYFTGILEGTGIAFLPRMEDYLGFAFQLLIAFGVIFETPLAIFLLAAGGIVDYAGLKSFRRYWIVVAFIIAAVLTPPDVLSQLMMGVPMLLLYEVGVFSAWLVEKRTGTRAD